MEHEHEIRQPDSDAPFDRLPDEVVIHVLRETDPKSAGAWSLTSRRHQQMALDDSIWRYWCETHFGPSLFESPLPPHVTWRWIYQAQCRLACSTGADVGAAVIEGGRKVYWGDTVDGQPHGFGLSVDQTSQVCDGHIRARLATGGRANNTSLPGRFQGQWTRGAMHGPGLTIDRDGTRVESHWDSGVRRDHVVITYADGNRYEGKAIACMPHGKGTKTLANGEQHQGAWEWGVPHGEGTTRWPNGDLCVGRWYSGKLHAGAYIWPDGQRYDGEFTDGRLHGRGSCTYVDGSHYDGEWVRGEKHGHGVMTYAGGHKYEGTWAHNQRDGHGIYTWTDGGVYEGHYCRNRRQGRGTRTYADGSFIAGVWDDAACAKDPVVGHRTGDAPCSLHSLCLACIALPQACPPDAA
ncbi:Morn repeat domain containing protein [Pandoravirus quercus]|uniref:Morn repeat domain containing protein n=1 Tax=Pandoravirus quercus TaxID=2107709 RepID=A0A2U7U9S9_9VIRU|nr:Morn repeat domain containing protein [Pandoravirus quercus]AVK75186.1 Morn repeat domain containing protein [Pandoravirus quercus]